MKFPTTRSFAVLAFFATLAIATTASWTLLETATFLPQPALEDAAMLFRYAENLANGGGLAWNYGENPGLSDGATDLGFVLLLAPFVALGIPVTTAAWILNVVAVGLLGALIGWLSRRIWGLPGILTALLVILLMSGPVNRYVSSGFSPPIFGLYLSLVATAGITLALGPSRRRGAWFTLGVLAAGAGWWRPEGFALGPIILAAAVAAALPAEAFKPFLRRLDWLLTGAGFALVAVAWAAFRLAYFGHLLPSSAVMKSGGWTGGNAVESMQVIVLALLPVAAIAVARAATKPTRIWVFFLAVIAASVVWLPAIFHLNWWNRMQWPLIPALAIIGVTAIVSKTSLKDATRSSYTPLRFMNTLIILVFGIALIAILRTYSIPGPPYTAYEPHSSLSSALEAVDTSGVRLATSEAGLVPLAINGPALDTYGFNNYPIASTGGGALDSELVRLEPNLLITNGPVPLGLEGRLADPGCVQNNPESYLGEDWMTMHATLEAYARDNDMNLIRSFETGACLAFSIYAGPDVPDEVLRVVREFQNPSREIT